MIHARSHVDLHNIRLTVERTRKLSDRVVGIGPLGLGLDGVLAWIPGAGQAYSLVAGAVLLTQAVRARASAPTLLGMAALLLADSALSTAPIVGSAADMFFTGHKWAANILLKHLDETLYVEGRHDDPANADILAGVRSGRERRRVVFLGEAPADWGRARPVRA
jgi:hypothetical protein